jgi:hypothetical protein
MQRWQRRAHLWIWLIVAAVVVIALSRLIDDQPRLALSSDQTGER